MASASASASHLTQHHQSYQPLSHALAYQPQPNDQHQHPDVFSNPHPYGTAAPPSAIPSSYYQPGPRYQPIQQPPPDATQQTVPPGTSPTGEKRKRGRPKGSKTKKPRIDYPASTPTTGASGAVVSSAAPPVMSGPAASVPVIPSSTNGSHETRQAVLTIATNQSLNEDILNIGQFKWQVMNLCSEFYQVRHYTHYLFIPLTLIPKHRLRPTSLSVQRRCSPCSYPYIF